ncbi:MAG: RimK family alpha-L-glutamate ligase [Bacteroidales bacterium]|nr:RimK family alpha-L-glutamate ligase [Bacteroidales bacterium]
MKHLILSALPTVRLIEEIQKRGDDYELINPADLYAFISSTTSGHDRIYKRGEEKSERIKSKSFDAVIPRISGAGFEHGCTIVKQLSENIGIFSTGYERGLKICSNKMLTAQVLSKAKIRNPKQILAHQPTDYKELIDLVGGLPCVAKLQRGSMGIGVMLLETELAASTSLRSFQTLGADVILQQYIESGNPKNDIRVIVIGPETKNVKIFAYKRYALDTDFRSNYSLSGLGEKVELTKEEKNMAVDAALAVGLGVSGVDIMRDALNDDKPYVIEVNGNPGLKGVETVTGENVAGAIIDYVKDNHRKSTKFNNNSIKSFSLNSEEISKLSKEEYDNLDNRQKYIYEAEQVKDLL